MSKTKMVAEALKDLKRAAELLAGAEFRMLEYIEQGKGPQLLQYGSDELAKAVEKLRIAGLAYGKLVNSY